jgi:putative nucleotidyltransferase with HDIG domain
MLWSLNTLIPIFAILTYGIIFLVVALYRPQTQARKHFRVYLFSMLVWSICALLVFIDQEHAFLWFRMMIAAAVGSMLGLFHFIQTALDRRYTWAFWAYLIGVIGIFICLFSTLVVTQVEVVQGKVEYTFSAWILLVAGPGYMLCFFSLIELYRGFLRTENPIQRNRLRYLMLGLGAVILGSFVNWTPLGRYPLDIAANGVAALLISYAILRHQLLDISVVVRKGLLYSIPTTIIGAAYFLVISLAIRIFHASSGLEILFVSLIIAILAALIAQPIRDRAQFWIDRLFFREKYDSSLMLQRISRTAASVLDLSRLTQMILDEVASTLHITRATFFLKDEETGDFFLAAQIGEERLPNISLSNRHPIVLYHTKNEHALTRYLLEILPQFKALWGYEKEDLQRIMAELFIPLKIKGELVGIFAVGTKLSEEEYSHDDELTLTTLANQTAVAIQNARLYSAEQSRRAELDMLFELSRQLVATDDLDVVLGVIAREAVKIIHATFARILTIEDDGLFCRTSFPIRELGHDLCNHRIEPIIAQRHYQNIIDQKETVVLYHNDPILDDASRAALMLDLTHSLCLCPLMVGDTPIGLLVLGEARNASRETFDASKLRLVKTIADQAASALQRSRFHGQMEENFVQTVLALANVMDARDTYTHDHSQRLAAIAEQIAKCLDCDEIEIQAIRWAAYLHDIGKMAVPDQILRKPGPLNEEEWDIMKRHPEIGAQIVAPVKKLAHAVPIIRSHQEKFDGTGYPDRLKGDTIPLGARILAVVDAYGAMTDERVYRKARTHAEAVAELLRCSGTQFDPRIVQAFISVIGDKVVLPLSEIKSITKPAREITP